MRKILYIFAIVALALSCEDHLDVYFDTPFVSIADESGTSSQMTVDKDASNYLTTLSVQISASERFFQEPITVNYELIIGDGLKEGKDFEVQPSTKSPLTFAPGTYSKPIRIIWYKTADFDSKKDNTLTVKLTSTSVPDMLIGYPGPNSLKNSFIFTKK